MRSSKTSTRSSKRQSAGSRSKSTSGKKSRSGSKKSKSGSKKSKSRSGSKKSKMADDMCRCMKCKKGVKPAGATKKTLPNGRKALTGTCPVCGTKVFKFCKA